ncbi:hypothetical protein [Prauserella rugosa]|uniref:Uncharacterized protein n=1 Tax=Prauserella rugosa TaxID=43354 RepID=A0A660CM61_9PSEU|nr:hypothetical protein ACZ91_07250 [Streptomyces regensis]TWH22733.1 hypothetical protein JD82_04623 [Prauserella rugosa]
MLMKVLAKELAPHDIRVNTVHPTAVATDMILNESLYRLFAPDVDNPTRADFEKAAQDLNALPVVTLETGGRHRAGAAPGFRPWPLHHRLHAPGRGGHQPVSPASAAR